MSLVGNKENEPCPSLSNTNKHTDSDQGVYRMINTNTITCSQSQEPHDSIQLQSESYPNSWPFLGKKINTLLVSDKGGSKEQPLVKKQKIEQTGRVGISFFSQRANSVYPSEVDNSLHLFSKNKNKNDNKLGINLTNEVLKESNSSLNVPGTNQSTETSSENKLAEQPSNVSEAHLSQDEEEEIIQTSPECHRNIVSKAATVSEEQEFSSHMKSDDLESVIEDAMKKHCPDDTEKPKDFASHQKPIASPEKTHSEPTLRTADTNNSISNAEEFKPDSSGEENKVPLSLSQDLFDEKSPDVAGISCEDIATSLNYCPDPVSCNGQRDMSLITSGAIETPKDIENVECNIGSNSLSQGSLFSQDLERKNNDCETPQQSNENIEPENLTQKVSGNERFEEFSKTGKGCSHELFSENDDDHTLNGTKFIVSSSQKPYPNLEPEEDSCLPDHSNKTFPEALEDAVTNVLKEEQLLKTINSPTHTNSQTNINHSVRKVLECHIVRGSSEISSSNSTLVVPCTPSLNSFQSRPTTEVDTTSIGENNISSYQHQYSPTPLEVENLDQKSRQDCIDIEQAETREMLNFTNTTKEKKVIEPAIVYSEDEELQPLSSENGCEMEDCKAPSITGFIANDELSGCLTGNAQNKNCIDCNEIEAAAYTSPVIAVLDHTGEKPQKEFSHSDVVSFEPQRQCSQTNKAEKFTEKVSSLVKVVSPEVILSPSVDVNSLDTQFVVSEKAVHSGSAFVHWNRGASKFETDSVVELERLDPFESNVCIVPETCAVVKKNEEIHRVGLPFSLSQVGSLREDCGQLSSVVTGTGVSAQAVCSEEDVSNSQECVVPEFSLSTSPEKNETCTALSKPSVAVEVEDGKTQCENDLPSTGPFIPSELCENFVEKYDIFDVNASQEFVSAITSNKSENECSSNSEPVQQDKALESRSCQIHNKQYMDEKMENNIKVEKEHIGRTKKWISPTIKDKSKGHEQRLPESECVPKVQKEVPIPEGIKDYEEQMVPSEVHNLTDDVERELSFFNPQEEESKPACIPTQEAVTGSQESSFKWDRRRSRENDNHESSCKESEVCTRLEVLAALPRLSNSKARLRLGLSKKQKISRQLHKSDKAE